MSQVITYQWKGNCLAVDNFYVVTFGKRVPPSELKILLPKIDHLVVARFAFEKRLCQIKKEGLKKSEVKAYRLSSKLTTQTNKVKKLPIVVSIHFITEGSLKFLTQRVDCAYSRGCTEELDNASHKIIENCWVDMTTIVTKTLEKLSSAPIFDRYGEDTQFTEFNTVFQRAEIVFNDFSLLRMQPFNLNLKGQGL